MIMGGGDKKKIAALIVARVKPQGDIETMKNKNAKTYGEMASEPEGPSDVDEGLKAAAEDILTAIHTTKDPSDLARALEDFVGMCGSEKYSDDSEAEGSESSGLGE